VSQCFKQLIKRGHNNPLNCTSLLSYLWNNCCFNSSGNRPATGLPWCLKRGLCSISAWLFFPQLKSTMFSPKALLQRVQKEHREKKETKLLHFYLFTHLLSLLHSSPLMCFRSIILLYEWLKTEKPPSFYSFKVKRKKCESLSKAFLHYSVFFYATAPLK